MKDFAEQHPSHRISVLTELRPGASAARNRGIWAARGDIVAFLDSDCVADPGWREHALAPFTDPAVGAVAGQVAPVAPSSTIELFSALYTLQMPRQATRHERWTPMEGGFPTANLAVRRSLLEELRGFDEDIRIYGEDYDLCARLYQRAAVIVYTPDAKVFHHHRTTLRGMLRQAFGFGRSHPYLLRRPGRGSLWLELPGMSRVLHPRLFTGWLDFASADKKVMAIVLCGAFYWPALLLLPLYSLWLVAWANKRVKALCGEVSSAAAFGLAGLLLCKSFTLTLGRWWGSVKYGALCF